MFFKFEMRILFVTGNSQPNFRLGLVPMEHIDTWVQLSNIAQIFLALCGNVEPRIRCGTALYAWVSKNQHLNIESNIWR